MLAALCNSFIGIFTGFLYKYGMSSPTISFFRCLIALVLLLSLLLNTASRKKILNVTRKDLMFFIILSFFGIFIMYTFEILAIKRINVGMVSFLLYASGINTIILSCIFLKEKITVKTITSVIFVFAGIIVMFINNIKITQNLVGIFMAVVAGLGYSIFLLLMKKYLIASGLKTLLYLFLFGTFFLSLPLIANGDIGYINFACVPLLIALSIIPTISGFYFTSKALSVSTASKVQLFEMSEPFFAILFAYIFLKQKLSLYDIISGALILIGLLFLEFNQFAKLVSKVLNVFVSHKGKKCLGTD